MNWKPLTSIDQLTALFNTKDKAVLFKHSTRCPVSSMAKRSLEFESNEIPQGIDFYYLDLIAYREISNKIEELWGIIHESPQIIVIQGDQVLYSASHSDIDMQEILPFIL